MVSTNKKNKITIQDNNEIIELTGEELETFEADRQRMHEQYLNEIAEQETQKELKISAYKKLGLTDEEIAAII